MPNKQPEERARGLSSAPVDIGAGFQSFWMRDQQVSFEQRYLQKHLPSHEIRTSYVDIATAESEGLQRGDVVEIDKQNDPNHGRQGPIWSVPTEKGKPHEVWFEDGIQPYHEYYLRDQDFKHPNIDSLPEIRPNATASTIVVRDDKPALLKGYRRHPKPTR